jgi:hypothetical protein
MALPTDSFNPITSPAPDWSAAANWSGGRVPTQGDEAAITNTTAMIDPGVTIAANLTLTNAGLIGNGGAIILGAPTTIAVTATATLDAVDAIINQGILTIGASATATVVVDLGALSGLTGAPPPSFANSGTIMLASDATLAVTGTAFKNTDLISLAGGTLAIAGGAIGSGTGSGTIELSQGALATFGDGVSHQQFDFGPGGGTIDFVDPLFGPGIALVSFGSADAVLLPSVTGASLIQTNGFATITTDTGAIDGSFAIAATPGLSLVNEGSGSAIVILADAAPAPRTTGTVTNTPCFARGTAILTPSGYRPVEYLSAGDPVITGNGAIQPIIWAGQHTADLAIHPNPSALQPISITAGALAPGVPRRTLRVSPDHAILLTGALIPAKLLVNGATITQEHDCLAVTYHHLELSRHDIILAEGAPCETYLDTGNRAGFSVANSWPVRPKRWDRDACAPLVTTGTRLQQARRALHTIAIAQGFAPKHSPSIAVWVEDTLIPPDHSGSFPLPPRHNNRAIIRSPRFVPAHFDPASEDRRNLGIALTAIRTKQHRFNPDALADAGFHPRSPGDPARWTDGDATIRIPADAHTITLEIAAVPLTWTRHITGAYEISSFENSA